jgi:hypothetical protein
MIRTFLAAASLAALALTISPSTEAATIGREVAAPSWSAACMTDHGPSVCGEPMWVYGSSARVSRYKNAY